jgi:hypothetical protein
MKISNTQIQGLFSAIAKSDLREPKNLIAPDIKFKLESLVFTPQIISAKLIGGQSLRALIAQAKADQDQDVKDFDLGLMLIINISSGSTQPIDPEEHEEEDDNDDEDFDEDDDYEDEEEEVVKVVLNSK